MSTNLLKICSLAELQHKKVLGCEAGGTALLIAWVQGNVKIYLDHCLHQGARLSQGTKLGGAIICPGHFWEYDLETGQCINPKCGVLQSFEPVIQDQAVWINLNLLQPTE